jgi:hypothetical protein
MTITRSLIGDFLQTRSVDVINRSGELLSQGPGNQRTIQSLKLDFSLSIDIEDGGSQVCELCIL